MATYITIETDKKIAYQIDGGEKNVMFANIEDDGGDDETYLRIIEGDSTLTTINDSNMTKIKARGCSSLSGLTSATFSSVVTVGERIFEGCNNLEYASFPLLTSVGAYMFSNSPKLSQYNFPLATTLGNSSFSGTAIQYAVFPKLTGSIPNLCFTNCSHLEAIDVGNVTRFDGSSSVSNAAILSTIIIRRSDIVVPLMNASSFNGTPFANGGSGGTIYIPKALYDHLGDGSEYDYKAATNWSTINGYGTITWAQIEGSKYETHYADGTLIPTT